MARRRRQARGFSLIEAMIASAVLILGLTGITLMLIRGSTNGRNGQQMIVSADYANQVIGDFEANGFENLIPAPAGPALTFDAGNGLDGGTFTDASGRVYTAQYIVQDTGAGVNATYDVQVEVSYRDGNGQTVYRRSRTTMSKAPDAG